MPGLAPSIISADFGRLADELERVTPFSERWHVDVMDGHFVPNLTIGPMLVETIARVSQLPQDVHLMITNPADTWEWYAKAGAARIAFHPAAEATPTDLLKAIGGAGLGPGIAVNPDVAVGDVADLLPLVDHVVVMSVYPGFSGQKFIPDALPKLKELRRAAGPDVELIIDGGVNPDNANECVEAGADILVSASAVFGASDPAAVAEELSRIARDRST
ncbi:MAG TPA: ribulose-phosphate 3-epimerase [Actinomycetota bacterium]|jgi:ribulose-phosphate 3-epimerase|nr:ribulose-phosphate 3-epimerase [Actinomycetota bacterium]